MRVAALTALLVLVAAGAHAQLVVRGVSLRGVSVPAAAGGPCSDWTSAFVAIWRLEEASGTRANDTGTTCGSDCDLTDNNTVTQDTANEVEGTAAASFAALNEEFLSCEWDQAAACDEIETVVEGSAVSWGGWLRITTDCATQNCYFLNGQDFSVAGVQAWRQQFSNNNFVCVYNDANSDQDDTTISLNTTYHGACTWANDADDEIVVYVDGVAETGTYATSTTSAAINPAQLDFSLSRDNSTQDYDGMLDEWWIIAAELTAEEVCYICSCGTDGSACAGSGASYTDEGRNDTMCGSCTLPACNASAPS